MHAADRADDDRARRRAAAPAGCGSARRRRRRRRRRPCGCAVRAQRLGDLDAQLAGRREHERLDLGTVGIDVLDHRQPERGGLAGAGLRLADHVAALEQRRDRLLLDRARLLVADVLAAPRGVARTGRDRRRSSRACRVGGRGACQRGSGQPRVEQQLAASCGARRGPLRAARPRRAGRSRRRRRAARRARRARTGRRAARRASRPAARGSARARSPTTVRERAHQRARVRRCSCSPPETP